MKFSLSIATLLLSTGSLVAAECFAGGAAGSDVCRGYCEPNSDGSDGEYTGGTVSDGSTENWCYSKNSGGGPLICARGLGCDHDDSYGCLSKSDDEKHGGCGTNGA
ncbi:hypothetical protein NUU61_000920 [Penicillium alfredii]|uniref:Uncharacterized protein n=1 Tax=Penicillium alfredii TaxID=1506179 RepID=A0A9W9GAN0_9EURO|nr:uncharacterized protein NUU61_000920 [Penicillium alfredii]KAJ5115161.1 hypothetical protein NUU61_000920 [Penicillium alfredii]